MSFSSGNSSDIAELKKEFAEYVNESLTEETTQIFDTLLNKNPDHIATVKEGLAVVIERTNEYDKQIYQEQNANTINVVAQAINEDNQRKFEVLIEKILQQS